MLRRALVLVVKQQIRNYGSKRKREILSVLAQDTAKFPTYDFHRQKPTDRRLYGWGMAAYGALGAHQSLKKIRRANAHIVHHPSRQSFGERFDVLHVAAGYGFTLYACKPEADGICLFGSGINTDSQVGYHKLGGETNRPMEALIYPAPISLPKISDDEVIAIKQCAAGRAHSVALSTDNILYTMGNNSFGQCGRTIVEGEKYHSSQTINRIDGHNFVEGDDQIKHVTCGQDHTILVTEAGRVYTCGWGADGQTGLGHYKSADTFTRVAGDILNEKIEKVASTVDCVLALNDKGEVFGWGNSEYGQFMDDAQQVNTPIRLEITKHCGKIVDIATGGSSCMVLNDRGEVFVWGFGLLGIGPSVDYVKEPTIIPPALFGRNEFNPESKVISIVSGVAHMCAITNKHDLYMWGRNKFGCLGLGHEKDQFFPFQVSIGAMVLDVACGVDHTIAYCKPYT